MSAKGFSPAPEARQGRSPKGERSEGLAPCDIIKEPRRRRRIHRAGHSGLPVFINCEGGSRFFSAAPPDNHEKLTSPFFKMPGIGQPHEAERVFSTPSRSSLPAATPAPQTQRSEVRHCAPTLLARLFGPLIKLGTLRGAGV